MRAMKRTCANRYLPNLDGLRAISVLIVILGHATSLQLYFGGYQFKDWLWVPGKFGVVMFFCISGILISHLLDQERERDRDINIKQFYIRRAARIWPLYFMVVIPGLAINFALAGTRLHTEMGPLDYVFMAVILPGFADRPMFVGPTWSIGIEESFYAVYPLMVRYMTRRILVATSRSLSRRRSSDTLAAIPARPALQRSLLVVAGMVRLHCNRLPDLLGLQRQERMVQPVTVLTCRPVHRVLRGCSDYLSRRLRRALFCLPHRRRDLFRRDPQ